MWLPLAFFTTAGMVEWGLVLSNKSLRLFFLVDFYSGFGIYVYFVGDFLVCYGIFHVHLGSNLGLLGNIVVYTV